MSARTSTPEPGSAGAAASAGTSAGAALSGGRPGAGIVGPSLLRRIYGLGSVFGKALRESRRGFLLTTGWIVLLLVVSGAFVSSSWGTEETRQESVRLAVDLPEIITGLYGGSGPNVDTLGGFTSWRYGILFFVLPGIWSLLALSNTLTAEGRRGSMDFIAAGPLSRRRIALQKLGGHAVAMTLSMLVAALVAWSVGTNFATLPGDEIPLGAALSYVLLMGLCGLSAGTIAFALAPLVGRRGAAGIAGAVLAASWIVKGYQNTVPLFEKLRYLSWFAWTEGHRPIAGTYDWPSLLPLAALVLAAGTVGVLLFERRDIGDTGSLRTPGMPPALLGLRGPLGRSLSERVSVALYWGLGIGFFGLIVGASSSGLRDAFADNPSLDAFFRAAFPTIDLDDPGFMLQLMFVQIGTVLAGLGAATVLSGWASDEQEGRLELLLTTSLSRARWFLGAGAGALLALVATAVVASLAAGVGVAIDGEDPGTPIVGGSVIALYAMAAGGVGLGVGGLFRAGWAAPATAIVVASGFMIEILVPALDLPRWVLDLTLSSHYGEPMVGNWDWVGIVVSLGLAVGGLLVGAWGFSRRDLKG